MYKSKPKQKNIVNDAIIKDLSDSIHSLAYGTVIIKINHSRIVQIEVTENMRFDEIWHLDGRDGF